MVLLLHMVLGKCCHTCWSHKNFCEYHCNFQSFDEKMCSKHFHFSDNFLTLVWEPQHIIINIFQAKDIVGIELVVQLTHVWINLL
jgi:hypothetical protein